LQRTPGSGLNWIQKAALDKGRLSESTSFQNVLMLKVGSFERMLEIQVCYNRSDPQLYSLLAWSTKPFQVSESLTKVAASVISDVDRDGNAALRAVQELTNFWEGMLTWVQRYCDSLDILKSFITLWKLQSTFLQGSTIIWCTVVFSGLVQELCLFTQIAKYKGLWILVIFL
jgi:hypothetical protein